jgi:hypothetical protein
MRGSVRPGATFVARRRKLQQRAPSIAAPYRAQVVPVEPTKKGVSVAAEEGDPAPIG